MDSSSQDHHLDSSFEVSSTVGSSSSSDQLANNGPLSDLSSLLHQLPIKRGLSKHYQGKSRSFTSLSDVRCMEDLVKAEHPYSKKLKPCKSYVGLVPLSTSSRVISKKLSNSRGRGSCCFLGANRSGTSFLGSRPPISPHRSTRTTSKHL